MLSKSEKAEIFLLHETIVFYNLWRKVSKLLKLQRLEDAIYNPFIFMFAYLCHVLKFNFIRCSWSQKVNYNYNYVDCYLPLCFLSRNFLQFRAISNLDLAKFSSKSAPPYCRAETTFQGQFYTLHSIVILERRKWKWIRVRKGGRYKRQNRERERGDK